MTIDLEEQANIGARERKLAYLDALPSIGDIIATNVVTPPATEPELTVDPAKQIEPATLPTAIVTGAGASIFTPPPPIPEEPIQPENQEKRSWLQKKLTRN